MIRPAFVHRNSALSAAFCVCFLIVYSQTVWAGQPKAARTKLQALAEINPYWLEAGVDDPELKEPYRPTSRHELAKEHFRQIEKALRKRKSPAKQEANRLKNLDALAQYAAAARFPRNDYLGFPSPVFIDMDGEPCALAYLMNRDGKQAEVLALAACCNHEAAAQFPENLFRAWANESGFTEEELAWIQPYYPAMTEWIDLQTNAPVAPETALIEQTETLLANVALGSGLLPEDFPELTARFQPEWNEIDGRILSAAEYGGQLHLLVNIAPANPNKPAYYLLTKWNGKRWQTVQTFDPKQTVNALFVHNGELYAGGGQTLASESTGQNETAALLQKWNGKQWTTLKTDAQGAIFAFALQQGRLVAGATLAYE